MIGSNDTIPQIIESINNVTKEDIVRVANQLELQVIYFLKNSHECENAE